MQNQTIFGVVAMAFITGMIIGAHISNVQGTIRCQEALATTLISNNLAWYDPMTGEFVVLKVQPMQHLIIPKEIMEDDVLRGIDQSGPTLD